MQAAAAPRPRPPQCYVIAGVSGSGKSTVGKLLAVQLGCAFHDADDFHNAVNREKMRGGTALTDDDRQPWLEVLADVIAKETQGSGVVVLACSALKQPYRDVLLQRGMGGDAAKLLFVLLQPPKEELVRRLHARAQHGTHFMPPSLLDSQLAALELCAETGAELDAAAAGAATAVRSTASPARLLILTELIPPEGLVGMVLSHCVMGGIGI